MTGIETASMMPSTRSGSLIRATPPCARMSAGTRSSAITATAPASSAILAWSAVTTSMITPPLSISAIPRLTRAVPVMLLVVAPSGLCPGVVLDTTGPHLYLLDARTGLARIHGRPGAPCNRSPADDVYGAARTPNDLRGTMREPSRTAAFREYVAADRGRLLRAARLLTAGDEHLAED